jgi:hypothetical protein
MEEHQYFQVNSEKIIFIKSDGDDFILHGKFVDDFASIPTSKTLKLEFEELYAADFEFSGRKGMDSFLGIEVELSEDGIEPHLDKYVTELLEEYREYHCKFLKTKKGQRNLGSFLIRRTARKHPTQSSRSSIA